MTLKYKISINDFSLRDVKETALHFPSILEVHALIARQRDIGRARISEAHYSSEFFKTVLVNRHLDLLTKAKLIESNEFLFRGFHSDYLPLSVKDLNLVERSQYLRAVAQGMTQTVNEGLVFGESLFLPRVSTQNRREFVSELRALCAKYESIDDPTSATGLKALLLVGEV